VSYVQPDSPNFNAWRRHLRLHNPTQSEDLRDAWEDVKAMFNGGNRKRSASGTTSSLTRASKSSAIKDHHEDEKDEMDDNGEDMSDDKKKLDDDDDDAAVDDDDDDDNHNSTSNIDDDKVSLPLPPPVKVSKIRTRDKKLPIHNVVSSTTMDEQIPDLNMFLPFPLPPLPTTTNHPFFPFPPPLPSSNSFSFVTMNSTDWLQFFRSPLFVPSAFHSPFPNVPRRFPSEMNNHTASVIGSGSQSAFKPPIQKHD
jgi:hypothetical protein